MAPEGARSRSYPADLQEPRPSGRKLNGDKHCEDIIINDTRN